MTSSKGRDRGSFQVSIGVQYRGALWGLTLVSPLGGGDSVGLRSRGIIRLWRRRRSTSEVQEFGLVSGPRAHRLGSLEVRYWKAEEE